MRLIPPGPSSAEAVVEKPRGGMRYAMLLGHLGINMPHGRSRLNERAPHVEADRPDSTVAVHCDLLTGSALFHSRY